ncbi:MAG: hypothetical protein OJF50_001001 [Nitrospira sp.]|nr:hypothetical protein [Nitrospira sp.]
MFDSDVEKARTHLSFRTPKIVSEMERHLVLGENVLRFRFEIA